MEQVISRQPLALVVEDDFQQRSLLETLLEEGKMQVVGCDSAETAMAVLDRIGDEVRLMFTDVGLTGRMTGVDLAATVHDRFPAMRIVVTSGQAPDQLPAEAKFIPKPWLALDVLSEAETVVRSS